MAKNYAVETVSSLPFGMLIGAPLNAAIEAQTQAAKATIDFIMQVGFLPASVAGAANPAAALADPDPVDVSRSDAVPAANLNPATNAGQTRMVTFMYTTTNEDAAVVAAAAAAATAAAGANPATVAAAGAADRQARPLPVAQRTEVPLHIVTPRGTIIAA